MPVPDPRFWNDDVPDEVVLTQFGRRSSGFKNRPALEEGEFDLSLLDGDRSIEEAAHHVAKRVAVVGDGVRKTTAGQLRGVGLLVSVTSTVRTKSHRSAFLDGDWTVELCKAVDACFYAEEWKG